MATQAQAARFIKSVARNHLTGLVKDIYVEQCEGFEDELAFGFNDKSENSFCEFDFRIRKGQVQVTSVVCDSLEDFLVYNNGRKVNLRGWMSNWVSLEKARAECDKLQGKLAALSRSQDERNAQRVLAALERFFWELDRVSQLHA